MWKYNHTTIVQNSSADYLMFFVVDVVFFLIMLMVLTSKLSRGIMSKPHCLVKPWSTKQADVGCMKITEYILINVFMSHRKRHILIILDTPSNGLHWLVLCSWSWSIFPPSLSTSFCYTDNFNDLCWALKAAKMWVTYNLIWFLNILSKHTWSQSYISCLQTQCEQHEPHLLNQLKRSFLYNCISKNAKNNNKEIWQKNAKCILLLVTPGMAISFQHFG